MQTVDHCHMFYLPDKFLGTTKTVGESIGFYETTENKNRVSQCRLLITAVCSIYQINFLVVLSFCESFFFKSLN